MSQKRGRDSEFADYAITIVTPKRTYPMKDRTQAPEDSNRYFDVR